LDADEWRRRIGAILCISSGKSTVHRRTEIIKEKDAGGHTDAEAMCYDGKRKCIWINSLDGLITIYSK
jgi:hypothetical protein